MRHWIHVLEIDRLQDLSEPHSIVREIAVSLIALVVHIFYPNADRVRGTYKGDEEGLRWATQILPMR